MYNICIFDTETTGLVKPFCYNIGYIIHDLETGKDLLKREFVVEQIWHNIPLFSTAYYADKRPIYIKRMRARKILLEKFGYITQIMKRDFKKLNVKNAYAYNSTFDKNVFEFNCDFFKVLNPFDNVEIFDIWTYAQNKIAFTDDYKAFCEKNELFTETGNFSTNAENIYKFITNDNEFIEEHTALNDSKIELAILLECVKRGAQLQTHYKKYSCVPRHNNKPCKIKVDNNVIFEGTFQKKYATKDLKVINLTTKV
jgi:hypothetical protein